MKLASPKQNFQDWFTQQWAIFWGKEIESNDVPWLMGAFGKPGAKADDFIHEIAKDKVLEIERNTASNGLLASIQDLNFSSEEYNRLSKNVVDFYEKTADYELSFAVKWNPFFKFFGKLINYLFSNRINQLNVPTNNFESSNQIKSEIIRLVNPESKEVKYTVWYRTFESTQQVLYSGIYSTCELPSGKTCIKAVFPLPNGNATVIMTPSVGVNGELLLISSGKKFGDAGFYFLLNDSKGRFWSQYIRSFQDRLIVSSVGEKLVATQKLTLWNLRVLEFQYEIKRKGED
ncbi:hypothetical protein [Moheibacter sediminis]|uniref:Uncharacterized protein n=1 Tax=Moheibacter sediminis TaxID=1434700 RepID=A0A1W1ZV73_9FLAO|nr:hypothetical protein [Moheibacter sediminis]SMC52297.1 hypothetical protein SAMN06296427_103261 [Moheibacter sediminis]